MDALHSRRALPAGLTLARWTAPDGWPLRAFAWDAAGKRGSLLFLGGRGDFLEKYLEAHAHWHGRGWRVDGFDWRGQGGSGRLLADARIGHAASFTPLIDDLAAFVAEWRARAPCPHVVVGHSMGGHLLLRLLAERAPGIDAAVLVAPMLGLASGPLPAPLLRAIAAAMVRLRLGERSARREAVADLGARQARLTSCRERYADEIWWRGAAPDLALGPPSWGWLDAALGSMARLTRPGVLEGVRTPLLILATPRDRLVSADAIRAAAMRLPDARAAWIDGAHELLREADPARRAALAAIDAFLDTAAPA